MIFKLKNKYYITRIALSFLLFTMLCFGVAAQEENAGSLPQKLPDSSNAQTEPLNSQQTGVSDTLAKSQNITLDFVDADIRNVLKIISFKSGVNIVTTPEVVGNVTIRLSDVAWEKAMDIILKTYNFGYEKQGNIILVAPIDKLTAQKKQEVELAQVQPTQTEVFVLKYLDAQDAKKSLEAQLSARGKITVLEMTGQSGWEFGAADLGKRKRVTEQGTGRSKVLIISDVPPALDRIREVIAKIDVRPLQILIETRIMEVSKDKLKDIGFDWGTGTGGAETSSITTTPVNKSQFGNVASDAGGHALGSQVKPSIFGPKAGSVLSGVEPFNVGLEVLFRKLTGTQFEAMLHALEEDVNTNTLSAPRIMALNNQEASIVVGTRYPILKTETTTSGSDAVKSITLDYYQDIGIQLNVVPQVGADNSINMVVHPVVSSFTQTLSDNAYPILDIREAETRVIMNDAETVVIGGLLKDVKSKSDMGIPFLSKIPLLGIFFKRNTVDTEKIDLLIFISAHIVKEGEFTPDEIKKFEERMAYAAEKKKSKKKQR